MEIMLLDPGRISGEDPKKTAYNILFTLSFLLFHSRNWRDSKRLQTQKAWYYMQRTTKRLKWVSSEESKSNFVNQTGHKK